MDNCLYPTWNYNHSYEIPQDIICDSYNRYPMARLSKTLEDRFLIPVLLRPIGGTTPQTILNFSTLLNAHFTTFKLQVDEASEVITHLKDILKHRPTNLNPYYRLVFRHEEPLTEWPELEITSRSHFVIGINDSKDEDPDKIRENLLRFRKQMIDERRHGLAILLLNSDKETYYKVQVDRSFIFLPNVEEQDLTTFLQMEMNKIVKDIVFNIGTEIRKLQNEDNDYIVFNKNEEKPEQRTLKKKKKGRSIKLAADFCLLIASEEDAFEFYKDAFELLKRLDDYLWMMSIQQGKAAVYLSQYSQALSQPREEKEEDLNALNDHLIQAILNIKKAKFQTFLVESYFIAFKVFQKLDQRSLLEEWVGQFISEQLKMYVAQDQAIYLSEIGLIYKNLGMIRKCNYYFHLAADIYFQRQPAISRMFFQTIRSNYPQMTEWTKLYSLVLKELLKSDPDDNFEGRTYAQLIDRCHPILLPTQLNMLIQRLNFSYFEQIDHSLSFLKLINFEILEPRIIPKINKLIKIKKQAGVVVAPRKREEEYKYEMNTKIGFTCDFLSDIRQPLSFKYLLLVSPLHTSPHINNATIEQKCSQSFSEVFREPGFFKIEGVVVHIWNYRYPLKLHKDITIEVYEENSHYEIVAPEELVIEKSSQLEFNFKVRNLKPVLSHLVKMNISIYYSIEVGLQENIVILPRELLQSREIHVSCIQSHNKEAVFTVDNNTLSIALESLKAHREFLRKVEVSLQYIRQPEAKYQINITKVMTIRFREKIQCSIVALKNSSQGRLLSHQSLPVWQDKFSVIVNIHKEREDKKAYEISILDNKGNLLLTTILSDQSERQEQIIFQKVDVDDAEEYLKSIMTAKWKVIANPKENGIVKTNLQPDLNSGLIKKSDKRIVIDYIFNEESIPDDQPILITPASPPLLISYSVSCSTKIPHKISLESTQFSESCGFVIEGKVVLTARTQTSNDILVQFSTNYPNSYSVVIQFPNQVFICERIIRVKP